MVLFCFFVVCLFFRSLHNAEVAVNQVKSPERAQLLIGAGLQGLLRLQTKPFTPEQEHNSRGCQTRLHTQSLCNFSFVCVCVLLFVLSE